MAMINTLAGLITSIAVIGGAILFAWRVLKKLNDITGGVRSMERDRITSTYYKHSDDEEPTLRQYERESLDKLYASYITLGGNSFVQDLYKQMRNWKVIN